MTTTKRPRGRPPGYPAKKMAVLNMIADEAVATPQDFVVAPAIRRALKAHGCHINESNVSDHARSFRKHKAVLVQDAQRRRAPPPRAHVPSSERAIRALPIGPLGLFGGMPVSSLVKSLDRWKDMAAALTGVGDRHAAMMKKYQEALNPNLGVLGKLDKSLADYQRLFDRLHGVDQLKRFGF